MGRACVVQLMNYRKNGDAFVNYLSVTPIHDASGVLTHYVGIQSDITELVNHKKAELAAKHAAVQVTSQGDLLNHDVECIATVLKLRLPIRGTVFRHRSVNMHCLKCPNALVQCITGIS